MKIQNKFVKIRTNNRNVETHNYICDDYITNINLSQFADNLENFSTYSFNKVIYYCCLKFDTPVEMENAEFTDFDVCIHNQSYNVTGAKDRCNATYIYNSSDRLTLTTDLNENVDINDYLGKKVMSIGFFNSNYDGETLDAQMLAFLDVSDYNIIISEDEKLVVIRSDDFITNMECIGYEYPYHLAPFHRIGDDGEGILTRLYSIGFGSTKDVMREEFLLDENEITITKTNNNFSFYIKTGEEHTIYPSQNLYSGTGRYPMKEYQFVELYPHQSLHPSNRYYPMKANVKYIIFKYKFCYFDWEDNLIDMNKTYTMNFYSPTIGLIKILNKIERRS